MKNRRAFALVVLTFSVASLVSAAEDKIGGTAHRSEIREDHSERPPLQFIGGTGPVVETDFVLQDAPAAVEPRIESAELSQPPAARELGDPKIAATNLEGEKKALPSFREKLTEALGKQGFRPDPGTDMAQLIDDYAAFFDQSAKERANRDGDLVGSLIVREKGAGGIGYALYLPEAPDHPGEFWMGGLGNPRHPVTPGQIVSLLSEFAAAKVTAADAERPRTIEPNPMAVQLYRAIQRADRYPNGYPSFRPGSPVTTPSGGKGLVTAKGSEPGSYIVYEYKAGKGTFTGSFQYKASQLTARWYTLRDLWEIAWDPFDYLLNRITSFRGDGSKELPSHPVPPHPNAWD